MPIARVRGVGSKGVIKDLPAFELPSEAWSHANNVKFVANRVEKIQGYAPVLTEEMPDEAPLAILGKNNTGLQIYATSKHIYQVDGRVHTNISKDKNEGQKDSEDNPLPYDPYVYEASPDSTWYYTTLSNAIILNTPREIPQGMAPHEARFHDLPGWGFPKKDVRPDPDNPDHGRIEWSAGRIRAYKNYLLALDMTEDNLSYPQRIRWSNVAYVNALPLDWIEDDINRDGGFNDLSDANGKIVDGIPLRDSFIIYTDKETYIMDYVGGVNIFSFKKLFSDSGILSPECAVEFEQKHFVISKDDIFIHNGSSRQAIASGRVKDYLISEITSVNPYATKVTANPTNKEIWISYVGPGQTSRDNTIDEDVDLTWVCNKCAIWNWEWDTWYFMDIPPSYDINIAPPPPSKSDLSSWDELQGSEEETFPVDPDKPAPSLDPNGLWNSEFWANEVWSDFGQDFVNGVPFCASPDKALYVLNVTQNQVRYVASSKTFNSRPVVAELTRFHMDLDDVVESTRTHKFFKTITPQFSGFGKIHCYIGGSPNATQSPTWDNYSVFDIEEDLKIDVFSNNRYPAVRFVDFEESQWNLQGYDIEFVLEGTR